MGIEAMATYKEIQNHIRERHGFTAKTCWIADIKDRLGLISKQAPNRKGVDRLHPCPKNKESFIIGALKHFEMIE